MSTLDLKITLKSPTLLAATPPASNLIESLEFIPGNTIRGLLAKHYIDQRGSVNDVAFKGLFLSDHVRYGFARLQGAEALPLSARSCKYDSGFNGDNNHGVIDLLLADSSPRACPHCGRSIDYLKGFWDPQNYQEVTVKTRLITHTAIDPHRATARTGQLYSQRVLEEGQVFRARIVTDTKDLKAKLKALFRNGPFSALVGTGTSRGQGWVEVSQENMPVVDRGTAKKRFATFPKSSDGKPLLAVTLLSDGLFRDDYLRYVTAPTIQHLASLGINPDDWEKYPTNAFMDTRLIFGFDGEPIHLPRQPRLAVAAGSVFLFKAKANPLDPKIPNGEGVGWIGEGSGEGYGQAVLWHSFHVQPDRARPAEETAKLIDLAEESLENRLIRQARDLHQKGFMHETISPSQMAAVAEKIRTARNIQAAQKRVEDFLTHQLKKLRAEAERTGKPGSWATPASVEGGQESLGELLRSWITEEKYLKQAFKDAAQRLDALKRFWRRFHGFYRYRAEMSKSMTFVEIDQKEKDTGD